ncbi:hypothetical protein [Antrihabitans sp. YC2-6]|uniref:hypothetical protein n=1 Tax=Antrihabitans sp. YC2-6 TaxID=2799498 RepID=UPI0018F6511C|nr:hypothetical protein [Antrihabitans sp. YC2-6]MBJ8347107.1 hypothetical protein [Antrihabitans sp. YC2-6]
MQEIDRSTEVPDDDRTTRAHAGESLEDSRNWPGLVLVAIGMAALGVSLTSAGYGFAGWALLSAGVCALCLGAGVLIMVLAHRRVKSREGLELTDPQGH